MSSLAHRNSARRAVLGVLGLAAVVATVLGTRRNEPAPQADSLDLSDKAAASAPAALSAQLPQPAPAMQPALRPRKTWIAPGTPCEFQQPYLKDFAPSVIRKDGTQVYRGIPMKMRQPDGTMKECPVTVTVTPAASAPVLAEEFEATPETQAQAPAATGK